MKRLIAFALALAVVFGVSFALYKPERIEAAAQETMDDEWVGYFFALEPFDGRCYATENGDDYDFGVPGVPVFVTITAFEPDDPDYEEGSEFNYSVGAAVSDEVVGSGMRVNVDDAQEAGKRRGHIGSGEQIVLRAERAGACTVHTLHRRDEKRRMLGCGQRLGKSVSGVFRARQDVLFAVHPDEVDRFCRRVRRE